MSYMDVVSHTWEEMLFESMVVGEGLALVLIYFYHDVISDQPIRRGLQRVIRDEESHVEYGERKIMQYLAQQPTLRERLLLCRSSWSSTTRVLLPVKHQRIR